MLLGIEPRTCRVCNRGLYRNVTMLTGGWSRCTVCNEFVHYGCLAAGKSGILKARPRVCQACRPDNDGTASDEQATHTSAVGS